MGNGLAGQCGSSRRKTPAVVCAIQSGSKRVVLHSRLLRDIMDRRITKHLLDHANGRVQALMHGTHSCHRITIRMRAELNSLQRINRINDVQHCQTLGRDD